MNEAANARARRVGSTRLYARSAALPGATGARSALADATERTVLRAMLYGDDGLEEVAACEAADLAGLRARSRRLWLDVSGLADHATIDAIGHQFGLHPLALEDVVHVRQRAKVEEFPEHLFVVVRIVDSPETMRLEQLSMFIGADFLITFQEHAGDFFDGVRARLRQGRGRVRAAGPDYLAHALLDAAIDGFFPVLEALGERIETLEDAVIGDPQPEQVDELHQVKRELLDLRRALWPARDMVNTLIRNDSPLITDATRLYLRDCHDHTLQLIDIVETYRELASGLLDVYLSSLSARLNEVMKLLTIISTIFIPLGFIAGVYGMNFDPGASAWNMPELAWAYGYPFALALMLGVAAVLLGYFRRRGWLGGRPRPRARPRS
jgi:magnesium transporter